MGEGDIDFVSFDEDVEVINFALEICFGSVDFLIQDDDVPVIRGFVDLLSS